MKHYGVNIRWSQQDAEYVATIPEFPGISALGGSWIEALDELHVAMLAVLSSMEEGEALPEPTSQISGFAGRNAAENKIRDDEREACCRDACYFCNERFAVVRDDETQEWFHVGGGIAGGDACDANRIRERGYRPQNLDPAIVKAVDEEFWSLLAEEK